MKVIILLSFVATAVIGKMYDCSQGATCADNGPLTFEIPGSDQIHCCEQEFDGYSVPISWLDDKVQAKCKCYTNFIG